MCKINLPNRYIQSAATRAMLMFRKCMNGSSYDQSTDCMVDPRTVKYLSEDRSTRLLNILVNRLENMELYYVYSVLSTDK